MTQNIYPTYINGQLYNLVYLSDEQIQQMIPMQEISFDKIQNNYSNCLQNQIVEEVTNRNYYENNCGETQSPPKRSKKLSVGQNLKPENQREEEKVTSENVEKVNSGLTQNNGKIN